MRRVAVAVAVVVLASFSWSCSESSSGSSQPAEVKRMIGPEGGVIEVGGAKVTFPAGALAASKEITIAATNDAAPDGFVLASKVFRCGPTGTDFAQPVIMEMPFEDPGVPLKMFWQSGGDPTFKDIGGERRGNIMVASVRHFSSGFVGYAK